MTTKPETSNKWMGKGALTVYFLALLIFTAVFIYALEKHKWKELNTAYYNSNVWLTTTFFGVPMLQNPCDVQQMQELLFTLKPDVIIECGTACGGSALYYATLMEQIKPTCKIFTIDITPKIQAASKFPIWDKHVTFYNGSSTDPVIVDKIKKQIPPGAVVFVTLDSDHSRDHVYKELEIYSKFVTPGSYLVVQDTKVNGHPVYPSFGPGPMEAVNDFLKINHDYIADKWKERYFLTFYPDGWLRKVR